MPQAFYINLDRDVDRRAALEGELSRLGIAAERFSAVNGTAVPPHLAAYFTNKNGLPPLMKPGELGCYASHLGVYQRIKAADLDAALVLEDDAVLDGSLRQVMDEAIASAPVGWDLILLCGKTDRAERPLAELKSGRKLVRYSRIPPTTSGYLISRSGAEKMLNPSVRRIWPVDWDTRMPWVFQMDTYGVTPQPIRQNKSFGSTISKNKGRSRLRTGLPRPTAQSWTNNPIRTPASFLFNIRKLGFAWWLRCFVRNCGIKLGHLIRPLRQ